MYNDDYVILIDENGQPYIEHSVFSKARDAVKSAGRSAHKYVAKIGEGAKARYFYTQEELKAFYNRGKKALSDASGLTARRQVQATARVAGASSNSPGTRKAAGRAYADAVAKYARTPLGRIETFMQDPLGNTKRGAERVGAAARSGAEAVRSGASKAAGAVRSGVSKAAGAVRGAAERVGDWAGVDERRALNDAVDKYSGSNWFTRDINEHQLNRSWNDYLKTPLGRLEATLGTIRRSDDDIVSIPERVGNAARSGAEAVRSGASKAASAVRGGAERAGEAVRSGAERAGEAVRSGASKAAGAVRSGAEAVRSGASKAAGAVRGAVDNATGATARREAQAAYDEAVRNYENERWGDNGIAAYYAMIEAERRLVEAGGRPKR